MAREGGRWEEWDGIGWCLEAYLKDFKVGLEGFGPTDELTDSASPIQLRAAGGPDKYYIVSKSVCGHCRRFLPRHAVRQPGEAR